MELRTVCGYLVSDCGRVFLPEEEMTGRNRVSTWKKTLPFREMRPQKDSRGYLMVKGRHRKRMWVARLVAIGYLEKPAGKDYVNHLNGIKTDNRVSNLEWCTISENQRHAFRTGLKVQHKGEAHVNSILTEEQVHIIYDLAVKEKVSQEKIAKMFNCKQITVSNIKTKKSWVWLTDTIDGLTDGGTKNAIKYLDK